VSGLGGGGRSIQARKMIIQTQVSPKHLRHPTLSEPFFVKNQTHLRELGGGMEDPAPKGRGRLLKETFFLKTPMQSLNPF